MAHNENQTKKDEACRKYRVLTCQACPYYKECEGQKQNRKEKQKNK